jgi:hypothetical protein
MLAALVAERPQPLTLLLEQLAGWPPGALEFRRAGPGDAELDARQASLLIDRLADAGGQVRFRTGHLAREDLAAVWTSLAWLPAALPPACARALDDGTVPLGTLLPGLQRAERRALAVDGPAVDCSAVLSWHGTVFGAVAERVTPDYLAAVAAAHGNRPVARHRQAVARA